MNVSALVAELPGRSDEMVVGDLGAVAELGHRITVTAAQRNDPQLYAPPARPVRVLAREESTGLLPVVERVRGSTAALVRTTLRSPGDVAGYVGRCRAEGHGRRALSLALRYGPLLDPNADVVVIEPALLASRFPLTGQLLSIPRVLAVRSADLRLLELSGVQDARPLVRELRSASALYVRSEHHRQRLEELLPGLPAPACIRPGVRAPAGVADHPVEGEPVIAVVGRVDHGLGLEHVLVACAGLHQRGVAFRLVVVGDGPLRRYCAFSAESMGLHQSVEWLGPLPPAALDGVLEQAQVVVATAVEEEVTVAAVRALAHGLPVISACPDGAGATDLVSDGENGYVVRSRDSDGLADRLEAVLADASLRRRLGKASRQRALADHRRTAETSAFSALLGGVTRS